jgi:poly(A) polymerase
VDEEGRIVRDNVYGTIADDALRRDFTVNALYYNIADFSIIDYAGGMQDLERGVLRLLGDPETRYREDPVRMLRAVRFATKLGFRIEPGTEQPIWSLGPLLADIPPARLFDEMLKLFMGGSALANFEMLRHYDLFRQLFPLTEQSLSHEENHFPLTLINRGMANTDARIEAGKPVTPAFLFAVFLWEPVRERAAQLEAEGQHPAQALQHAGSQIIAEQAQVMATPRRFSLPMREIWVLQLRLEQKGGRRRARVLEHPRFRAAYDFLLLRGEAGEVPQEICDWWTEYQQANPPEEGGRQQPRKRPPRRRRSRSRRKPEAKTT